MLTKDKLREEEFQNVTPNAVVYVNISLQAIMFPGDPTVRKDLDYIKVLKLVAYAIIIVGGLLGNVCVLLTVVLNRSRRTTTNLYVANLAVADAMICIICMVPHALSVVTEDAYGDREFMCKFIPFTQMTCLTSSVLTLSAISCDRLVAILFPLHVRVTKQRTSVVITVVWIFSMAIGVPYLLVNNHIVLQWKNFSDSMCVEYWPAHWYDDDESGVSVRYTYKPHRALYYVVLSVTLFFLPLLIMITAYSLILMRLWFMQVPGEQHAANLKIQSRARKKVNKMVFVVLVVFIVCWTPLQGMVLYSTFGYVYSALPDWFRDFKWFSYYIAFANSFMNPIIYGGYNKTFREEVCILLRCGYRRNRYARSRRTFTTGVAPGPSHIASKTPNGASNRCSSQKSNHLETRRVYSATDGHLSPTTKETCFSKAEPEACHRTG